MAKKKDEQEYGDIIQNHELIKRTLMVAAFPGLIKEVVKKGKKTEKKLKLHLKNHK